MHASITLSGLSYSTADGHTLFKDISASFNAGLTGFVGRNGVGKTTLLKLIAGALAPSSGSVEVVGRIAVLDQAVSAGEGETPPAAASPAPSPHSRRAATSSTSPPMATKPPPSSSTPPTRPSRAAAPPPTTTAPTPPPSSTPSDGSGCSPSTFQLQMRRELNRSRRQADRSATLWRVGHRRTCRCPPSVRSAHETRSCRCRTGRCTSGSG